MSFPDEHASTFVDVPMGWDTSLLTISSQSNQHLIVMVTINKHSRHALNPKLVCSFDVLHLCPYHNSEL